MVSHALIRAAWRVLRRSARARHNVLSLAGPLAFVSVIVGWGVLVVVGFALMLWPRLDDGFAFDPALDPAQQDGFLDALYISLVNLASLGYGDIVPTSDLLRLLGPLETLIGLGLLTASISWILFLYRVLADYRSLSHEISLLLEVERSSERARRDRADRRRAVLADLTSRVVTMRDDLVHSPIAYYFRPRDARHALPVLLPALLKVVERCSAPDRAEALRFQARMLNQAIADLLSTIAEDFLDAPRADAEAALAGYRRDHLWASA